MATPWRYQPITERRQRDTEEFQTYANQRLQEMEQQSGGGGLLGDIWGGVGDAAGAVASGADLVTRGITGRGLPNIQQGYEDLEGLLQSGAGVLLGSTQAPRRQDPASGEWYRGTPSVGDIGSAWKQAVTDPLKAFGGAEQAFEERARDPGLTPLSRGLLGGVTAPEAYATAGLGGAASGLLRGAGGASAPLWQRGAANLVEPISKGGFGRRFVGELGLETGARAGSEYGERFGPAGTVLGALGGGLAGAQSYRGLESLAMPGGAAQRGLARIQGRAGQEPALGLGTDDVWRNLEAKRQRLRGLENKDTPYSDNERMELSALREDIRGLEDALELSEAERHVQAPIKAPEITDGGSTLDLPTFESGRQLMDEALERAPAEARGVTTTGNVSSSQSRMFPWLNEERRQSLRQRDYRLNSIKRSLGVGSPEDPIMTPIAKEYEVQRKVVPESQATLVSQRAGQYKDLFRGQMDEKTGLIDLDPAPATLQDIAARFPEYRPYLTDDQARFIEDLGDVFKRMQIEMRDAGMDVGTRPDVMEGGFYIPRGAATKEGLDAPKKVSSGRSMRGGKIGAQRAARFDSMAEGIQKGHEYRPVDEVIYDYVKSSGEHVYDNQLGGVLRETLGPEGTELLGKTVIDRMDPQIRQQYQSVRQQMVRVRDKIRRSESRAGVESRASDELDRALNDVVEGSPATGFRDVSRIPARLRQQGKRAEGLQGRAGELRSDTMRSPEGFPEARIEMPPTEGALRRAEMSDIRAEEIERTLKNVDDLVPEDLERVRFMDTAIKNTAQRAEVLAQRGGYAGQRAKALKDELTQLQEEFDRLKGPYRKELERARATPPDQQTVALANMNGWTFPIEAAEALNKRIRTEEGWFEKSTDYVNHILRSIASTADLSALGIHGLLAGAADPRSFGRAAWASIEAFMDADVARKTIAELDQVYRQKGQLTSEDWAASKLHFGSTRTEFTPAGNTVSHKLAQIQNLPTWTGAGPVIRASSRAFGGFGDIMRLQMANSIYERAAKQGIDVSTRKAREEIAMTANLMTGWSPSRLGGQFGAFASYAPRMYQAQFDITGKALLNGDISGKEARRAFRNLLGAGAAFVVAANHLSPDGMEPEEYLKPFRGEGPFGDPTKGWNSNFMRFRVAGQDISPFGTWDSLARLVAEGGMGVATGDMDRAFGSIRAKGSPVVSAAWDLFTGETLMGEKASLTNPDWLLDNVMPISIRQIAEDLPEVWDDPFGAGLLIGSETIGLKTTPESSYEKAQQVFNASGETYKVPNANGKLETATSYWDLNNAQRARFDEEHPEIAADIKSDPSEELQQYNQVKEMLAKEQQVSDMMLVNNEIGIDEWRDQFNDRRTFLRGAGEALFEGGEEGEVDTTDDLYNQFIEENTMPDGSVDWDTVDQQVAKLTPAQQQWIADNRSLGMTNLTQRYLATSEERNKYFNLPKYRGYSGDEAREVDDLYDRARATLNLPPGRKAPQMRMLRAIREVQEKFGFDQKVARGARRRVMGMMTQTDDRQRYLEQNPELAAFVGSGYLTPDEQQAIGGVDTVLRDAQRTQ